MVYRIILLSVATFYVLSSCDASHHEHEEGTKEEKHHDEIVFTHRQAVEAGLELETVQPGDFTSVIKVSGQILSAQGGEQTLVATADGIVSFGSAPLTEGANIEAGQTIITLSAKQLQTGDPVQKAQIEFETAEKEYQRAAQLVNDQIISAKEFDQVRQRYELAKAAYSGQAHQVSAQGVKVSAPKGGKVKNVWVKSGDYVTVGTPLLTLSQDRRLQLRAEVPQQYLRELRQVKTAHFRPAYENVTYRLSDLNGRLLSYGKAAGADSPYLPITFEFDNADDLVTGAFAEVYLLSHPKHDILSIPLSALTEEQGVYYVYVKMKEEEEAYQKREVVTGQDDGVRIEIVRGLSAGDEVVTHGAYQVKLAAASTVIPEGHHH